MTVEQGTLLVTGIGVAVAFAALWFAWRSASAAGRSADAAETSATTSERSATAAEKSAATSEKAAAEASRSADAAEASAAEAETANRLEAERRHDEIRPVLPSRLKAFPKESRSPGKVEVFARFQLARVYHVQVVIPGVSGERMVLNENLEPGVERDVHLATLDTGLELGVETLRFRFWPSGDSEIGWRCPCSRPGSPWKEPEGHWSVTVPVSYTPPPSGPFVMFH
ncbi:hypothetical protein SUDANB121_00038 [Nocardiopsis dassonvillei]|uniref:hypothetical protein n=1 Tax=Nocardiopsis dassonvillei TaxID=2014 RepID=UPI003F57461C